MIVQKLLLGVTLAAPIGPVSIEMIKRGLKDGFWAAFNIRLGGAVGNSLCLIAAFFGLSFIQEYHWLVASLGLMGSLLLLYLAYSNLKKARLPLAVPDIPTVSKTKEHNPLIKSLILGFSLAVFNPVAVVFWLGIFANDIDPNTPVTLKQLFLNFQIIIGVLLWGALLSLFLDVSRKAVNPVVMRFVTIASGLILLYFGFLYGYKSTYQLFNSLI